MYSRTDITAALMPMQLVRFSAMGWYRPVKEADQAIKDGDYHLSSSKVLHHNTVVGREVLLRQSRRSGRCDEWPSATPVLIQP
jgi:hypothetical protein